VARSTASASGPPASAGPLPDTADARARSFTPPMHDTISKNDPVTQLFKKTISAENAERAAYNAALSLSSSSIRSTTGATLARVGTSNS